MTESEIKAVIAAAWDGDILRTELALRGLMLVEVDDTLEARANAERWAFVRDNLASVILAAIEAPANADVTKAIDNAIQAQ